MSDMQRELDIAKRQALLRDEIGKALVTVPVFVQALYYDINYLLNKLEQLRNKSERQA